MRMNACRRNQLGMTLVEMMVGLAIGLFIVATALGLAIGQLLDDRTLLQESRMLIELQGASSMVAHDLRRAGYRGKAGVGIARSGAAPIANPYSVVSWVDATNTLLLTFSTDSEADENQIVDTKEKFGFTLQAGVLRMSIGNGGYQPMTDANVVTVTKFEIRPALQEVMLASFCEQPCAATDTNCPRQLIARYDIEIVAHSTKDARVVRSLKTSVRARNDIVTGACPT